MSQIKFKVLPRANRTGWESLDGRILFSRCKNGWSVSNRSTYNGGFSSDRERLLEVGIIGDGYKAGIIFETLEMARELVTQAFEGSINPPIAKIRQRPISYQLESERFDGPYGVPFKLRKIDQGWRIKLKNDSPGFSRNGVELYDPFIRLLNTKFKSRKAALEALELTCNQHLKGLKSLRLIDYHLAPKPQAIEISV